MLIHLKCGKTLAFKGCGAKLKLSGQTIAKTPTRPSPVKRNSTSPIELDASAIYEARRKAAAANLQAEKSEHRHGPSLSAAEIYHRRKAPHA